MLAVTFISVLEFKELFPFSYSTILKTEPEDISDVDYDHEDDKFNPMEVDLPESSGKKKSLLIIRTFFFHFLMIRFSNNLIGG